MKRTPTIDSDWMTIEQLLPPHWRELAEESGIRLDPRPEYRSKIEDLSVLLRLILHHVCTGSSLEVTTAMAAAMGVVDISAVGLHKWMRRCGDWLGAIAASMVGATNQFAADAWAGYEVIAADATTVLSPGAKQTTARVHSALRLCDLRAVELHVTGVEVGETLRNFKVRKGQLWLLDRGYCNANSVAHAVKSGGDVIVRFCVGPMPLFDREGSPLDARAMMLKSKTPRRISAHDVCVQTERGLVAGRLLVSRLPAAAAERAQRRLVKERGAKHVTDDARQQARYMMVFTTVPESRLNDDQVMTLYRLRWQVELGFKRDKSIGGLDKLPNFRPDTVHTWLCAMMVAKQIAQRLTTGEPFPPSLVGYYALKPTLAAFSCS